MTIAAIIQARIGSRRLPGKVLAKIGPHPVLGHVIDRVRAAQEVDRVLVATSTMSRDDPIDEFCKLWRTECVRGSETNVLSRFMLAARLSEAEVMVRITADCPLVSPNVIDQVTRELKSALADYSSNTLTRTFPHGLDTECFTFSALASTEIYATSPYDLEHVTPLIYNQPDIYRLVSCENAQDRSHYRITLDTQADLDLLRALHEHDESCYAPQSPWTSIPDLIEKVPKLRGLHRVAKAVEAEANGTYPPTEDNGDL